MSNNLFVIHITQIKVEKTFPISIKSLKLGIKTQKITLYSNVNDFICHFSLLKATVEPITYARNRVAYFM